MIKKILVALLCLLGAILILLTGLVIFLTVTEYQPEDVQKADRFDPAEGGAVEQDTLTVYAWNIGYAGLGEESDFFMDGGKMVNPPSQETVEKNLAGIRAFIADHPADAWLLQEVDVNSARTGGLDEYAGIQDTYNGSSAFAYNYNCPFVPIPLPPMGRVESGIATFTAYKMGHDTERISLPCPFSWPVRAANIKRCLLVTRLDIEGSDKELVLVNLHLEAYDDGDGKIAQTNRLISILEEEYTKGNYVIAGGDFNQTFPGALENFPVMDAEKWTPGVLEQSILPEGWQFACDISSATCRLLDQPYSDACQLYVIDGFILSPNVSVVEVETMEENFVYSDHNPVRLTISLD